MAECLHRRLDARDVAVMIRAPDIDDTAEPALVLIMVVGDIRGEVRRHAVIADDHAILVIAIGRGFQPKGAVFLIDIAVILQDLHGFFDRVRMQRALAEPVVERHIELLEVFLEDRELLMIGEILEDIQALLLIHLQVFVAILVDDTLRRDFDILAMVAILRELDILPQQLQIARIHRLREDIHLVTGIVDIVLAFNRVARRAQQVHERRARCRAAAMADMQRPRRIGAHIFHLDFRHILGRQLAELLPRLEDLRKRIVQHIALQVEIQKTGACDLCMVEPVPLNAVGQLLSNLARILMEHACRLHGKVRGEITELLLRRHR